jgi:hypothetical protein
MMNQSINRPVTFLSFAIIPPSFIGRHTTALHSTVVAIQNNPTRSHPCQCSPPSTTKKYQQLLSSWLPNLRTLPRLPRVSVYQGFSWTLQIWTQIHFHVVLGIFVVDGCQLRHRAMATVKTVVVFFHEGNPSC